MNLRRSLLSLALSFLVFFVADLARAETLQAPVGGKPISLLDRIACGPVSGGWTLEPNGQVRPPTNDDAIGRSVQLRVATASAGCGNGGTPIALLATARWPAIDPASLVVHIDEARAELRGKRLKGVRLVSSGAGTRSDDVCLEPRVEGANEVCTFVVSRKLPASPTALTMTWFPAGATGDESAVMFDADGRRVAPAETALKPSRIVVSTLTPAGANVDVSRGTAKVTLVHPEAVGSVDCAPAFCELEQGALVARGLTQTAGALRVRMKLLPRVFFAKGDTFDASPLVDLPILRCPMSLESGPPLADVDDARVVLELEGKCAEDAKSLRFFAGSSPADVVNIESDKGAAHVTLKVGRVDRELAISATRGDNEGTLVGVVKATARRLAPVAATLELEDGVPIDFVPTNRPALVHVNSPAEGTRVVLLPLSGVYEVGEDKGAQTIRAIGPAGGYVNLRFAIRATDLPGSLGEVNLGIVRDAIQRPLRQGNTAVPLRGIVELRCVDRQGRARVIPPGQVTNIPYEERDGCYVEMYRDKLRVENGVQKLTLDIDVSRADGSSRPEAHVTEPTVLRPAKGTRVAWVHGVGAPFDRVTVRVAHAQDEQHYAAKSEGPMTPPASQWSVITGTSTARLYLTAAIPTVLYRVSEKASSGILSLNFGVLSRLTWVDSSGNDGILAVEAGVTGVGLAPVDTSSNGQSLRQVASVAGLGLGVPIVNRATITQTSINLHAWFEYEISRALGGTGSPFGFIFGPSITFGNVGTYL
jgi:hypothetical protein